MTQASRQRSCEVPLQDYARIQLIYLPSALSNGKLFTDYSFPPDKSSLTYVYSGDDRYEKMIFKRPKEISPNAVFTGVGGVYETPFPWKRWKKTDWFEAAIAVVSLNFKQMDRLIPGYRNFDQSLQTDYIGCFCFKLWRFGEWIDIVVDDHLPTLDNSLLYCQAYGSPLELWGPLVEKAYAKCKKTYEANECGRTLDALTDLTGGVCEFYTPDINPPENLFHVLYKSCVNRSHMVCWRNDKLLTPTGFLEAQDKVKDKVNGQQNETKENGRSACRYLHLVTAATKFPLSDGRMIEMVRLLCPYKAEPAWNGKFAERDDLSWGTVNMEFYSKYKPLSDKELTEYWMTLEDFRCNFGGLIICSSETPFTTEGLSLERCYRRLSEEEIKSGQKVLFSTKDRRRSSEGKQGRQVNPPYMNVQNNNFQTSGKIAQNRKKRSLYAKCAFSSHNNTETFDTGILVRENTRTVKIDNTSSRHTHSSRPKKLLAKTSSDGPLKTRRKKRSCDRAGSMDTVAKSESSEIQISCFSKSETISPNHSGSNTESAPTHCPSANSEPDKNSQSVNLQQQPQKQKPDSLTNSNPIRKVSSERVQCRSDSIVSTNSAISECQSTFSTSDIMLNMQCGSRENSFKRPKSAPGTFARNASSGSLPNIIINNFIASSPDNFRSHGSWRFVTEYKGKWEKSDSGVSSVDMKLHSRNPRIALHVLHPDAVNQIIAPSYHGKSHVIISLMQDYRHGAPTANSLLVPVGFSVYKTKNPGRDEKRSLAKLSCIGEVTSNSDFREISKRFDLWPGSYFIVPYCMSDNHSGQFFVRVLAEKDPIAGKTGCAIS